MSSYALITGASRGIGRATALTLASEGYNLILTCHKNTDALASVITSINEKFPHINILSYNGDIGDSAFCDKMFDSLASKSIHPDVIINNAGISYIGLLQDMSDAEWNTILNTNLTSAFYICRKAIPHMISNRTGKIINISSVWGNVGASCEVAYSATKGGINAFTKALAKELAPSNIQVNAIAFGAIDTEMNDHLSPEDKSALAEQISAGRLGTASEAAAMISSILKSPDYFTGQVVTMDGGWC